MRVLQWLEAASGIFASVAGGIALVYLGVGPAYSTTGCHANAPGEAPICVTGTATLVQVNGRTAITLLSVLAALLLTITLGAVWHSLTDRIGARWMLWGGTGALTLIAVLGLLSIGIFLLPGVALAIVASLCAIADRRPTAVERANLHDNT